MAAGPEPLGAAAVAPVDDASPSTDTALPPAVTGTAALTGACTADASPFVPEVDAVAAGPEPLGAAAVAPVDDASPSTDTALPLAVTGAAAAIGACALGALADDAAVAPEPLEPEDGAGAVEEPELPASPSTLTAFPEAVTGALTSAAACVPLTTPLIELGEIETEAVAGAAGA